MKLGFLSDKNDFRAPLHPESIQKYNLNLFLEEGIFDNLNYTIPNEDNVTKIKNLNELDIVACVDFIEERKLKELKDGAVLIGLFDFEKIEEIKKLRPEIKVLSFFKLPRISRAQNLDALSSQANLLGYASVLRAANATANVIPMMTTAAGNIQPSKVLILGVGVAGLQAIATAKRLGARVWAFDIRSEAKDQVESLGAKFVEASAVKQETVYAQEVSDEENQKIQEALKNQILQSDIVLTFAQIPGKKAPVLIEKSTVENMKKNSVIVDLAAGSGGNCEGTKVNEVVEINGVKIVGETDILKNVKHAATKLYSENVRNLIELYLENSNDEIFVEMSS
ncbi:MAG: NAD(P)(+) transhydrogenase (Re/Si-specific) subunit alpha [Candidatus Actinomarina sp.]